jgi:hypothetical protein
VRRRAARSAGRPRRASGRLRPARGRVGAGAEGPDAGGPSERQAQQAQACAGDALARGDAGGGLARGRRWSRCSGLTAAVLGGRSRGARCWAGTCAGAGLGGPSWRRERAAGAAGASAERALGGGGVAA